MIDLIKAATLTNDQELQRNAQNTLVQQRNSNPQQFFKNIAQVFSNSQVDTSVRQSAGTIFVVSIKCNFENNFLWVSMPLDVRKVLKDMVLNSMVDKQKLVRRAAANIPRKQWDGIIQKLAESINNTDIVVKQVSILTIGFICQQLKEFNFNLEEQQQDVILTGIVMALKDSHPQVVEPAFKALRDGMPAVSTIMKGKKVRQYLITQLIEAISNNNFVEYCLQALLEFIRNNFDLLQKEYAQVFARAIFPLMQNRNEENICVVAMQFWSVFAREQSNVESNPNLNRFITGELGHKLVQILLENLCYVQETDDQANGISQGAAATLQSIFQEDSKEFEQKVLLFTSNTIGSQNWKYRQASIRAFATLILGLPQQESQKLVNSSLVKLASLLNDSHAYVKLSALKSLGLITEEVAEVILGHEKCLQILDFIVKMGQHQHFLKYVCKIVDNLSQGKVDRNPLSPHAGDLTKIFIDRLLQPNKNKELVSYCFNTAINLIKCSSSIELCKHYLNFVLETFPKVHGIEQERKELFSSGFLTIAQVCLMTTRKNEGSITLEQLSTLYNLVVQHYNKMGDVDGDGFYLVSALAYFLPSDRRLVDDFWKFIDHGLKTINQEQIFKSAISCICDLAGIYKDLIMDKLKPVLVTIIDLYQKNQISRELKLDVLMCIGELCLQVGQLGLQFAQKLMNLIFLSCQGACSISDQNYAQALQDSIIETLMCMVHGIDAPSFSNQLSKHMKYITEFVLVTTEKEKRPKLEYVEQSLTLLADIAHNFPREREGLQNAHYLKDRVLLMQKYNKDGHLSQIIAYIRQQLKISY